MGTSAPVQKLPELSCLTNVPSDSGKILCLRGISCGVCNDRKRDRERERERERVKKRQEKKDVKVKKRQKSMRAFICFNVQSHNK